MLLGVHVLCQYQILGVGFLWVPSDIRRALTGPVRSLPSSGGIEAAADARALPDERHPSLRPSLHVPPLSFRSRLSEIGCGRAGDSISAGIPTLVPGERINQVVVDCLRSELEAGMVIPDASNPTLDTFVVA